jgi:hypothetical protein
LLGAELPVTYVQWLQVWISSYNARVMRHPGGFRRWLYILTRSRLGRGIMGAP